MNVKAILDINCDCGESFGNWKMGQDEAMYPLVSSVNLACGFHAGDAATMVDSIAAIRETGLLVGAHCGLPDLLGFGRRQIQMDARDAYAYVGYQTAALKGLLEAQGMTLNHVKPHGAMYAMLRLNEDLGVAGAHAVHDVAPDAMIYWPITAGNPFLEELRRLGHRIVGEIYPDLAYGSDGIPVVERAKKASSPAEVAAQVERFIQTGAVLTLDGGMLELEADSICLHGDDPNGPAVAAAVREIMEKNDCALGLVDAGVAA